MTPAVTKYSSFLTVYRNTFSQHSCNGTRRTENASHVRISLANYLIYDTPLTRLCFGGPILCNYYFVDHRSYFASCHEMRSLAGVRAEG